MERTHLEGNLTKYFWFVLCMRRNYVPILSIFFLTLPDTTAKQIGIFSGIGWLAQFLFEIPSSYAADKFGHKRTLIAAALFMGAASTLYAFADSFAYFVAAAVFFALGFSFNSGTLEAFMHDTLVGLKRESEYAAITTKISGYVSLISAFIIILLPFLTSLSIRAPFYVYMCVDLIAVLIAFSFVKAPQAVEVAEVKLNNMFSVINTARNDGFMPLSLFFGLIAGCMGADINFRYPYLQSLGYPVVLIGVVMGMSRIVWFVLSRYTHVFKRFRVQQLLLAELVAIPLFYLLTAYLSNPYVVGALYSLVIGYYWVRTQVFTHHYLAHLVKAKRFKATMLSVRAQIESIFAGVIALGVGFVMVRSYKLGFYTMGVGLFVCLLALYLYMSPKEYVQKAI